MTALVVLTSGVYDLETGAIIGASSDATLVAAAFNTLIPWGGIGAKFVAIAMFLFAFTTVLGWSHYGSRAVEYLFGVTGAKIYRVFFVFMMISGAVLTSSLAWDISDTANGLMAIPNLIALLLLSTHVRELKQGKSIECPVYNFSKHRRSDETIHFESNDIVIVEGIMVFQVPALMNNGYDFKVAVRAKEDTRYERRFKRDQIERGRTPESIEYQWNSTVQPSCEIYIDPLADLADLVLVNDLKDGEVKNIEILEKKIREILGL